MIKLNIQRFGHTNSTSNYEFPQFIGTDKPQWLTDINQAFASIDTAIHSVSVLANLNSTKIGDLTDLTTDNKIDLVSAINEVDSHTDSNTNTLAGHTTAIGNNTTAIGNIADLDTVDKSNLVNAINEVNLIGKNNETKIGTLNNLNTTDKSSLVGAINEVDNNVKNFNLTSYETISSTSAVTSANGSEITSVDLGIAKNNDGSLAKIYGQLNCKCRGNDTLTFQTSLRPATDINVNGHVTRMIYGLVQYGIQPYSYGSVTMTIHTDGRVTIPCTFAYNAGVDEATYLFANSLLFIKDFGDYPIPRPI